MLEEPEQEQQQPARAAGIMSPGRGNLPPLQQVESPPQQQAQAQARRHDDDDDDDDDDEWEDMADEPNQRKRGKAWTSNDPFIMGLPKNQKRHKNLAYVQYKALGSENNVKKYVYNLFRGEAKEEKREQRIISPSKGHPISRGAHKALGPNNCSTKDNT